MADELSNQTSSMNLDGKNVVQTAAMPPTMAKAREVTADELIKEMNKVPLFMTSIDQDDEDQAAQLEAIRALAYEGTRVEIATNFKTQGNECVAEKQWFDAREFYSRAITSIRDPDLVQYEAPDVKVVEIDEEAEARDLKTLEEICLANRALCNLEMKNYGACNKDCAAALKLNPRNVKAWYRAASACLALDKVEEALDACEGGLKFDAKNVALTTLKTRIEKRQQNLQELNLARRKREERERTERTNLAFAIKSRGILTKGTDKPPDMEDAAVKLADPVDPKSILSFPVIFLYPLTAQSDFVKAMAEDETLNDHLSYVLPPPWDEKNEYSPDGIECYMETTSGGLIKAGKKLSLVKLLVSGKITVVDSLVKVNIVPKDRANEWIAKFKERQGKT